MEQNYNPKDKTVTIRVREKFLDWMAQNNVVLCHTPGTKRAYLFLKPLFSGDVLIADARLLRGAIRDGVAQIWFAAD